jgi:hypothetical protein
MRKSPKFQWIIFVVCLYVALCVIGFLYIFVGDGFSSPGAAMSTGRFLFLLLVAAPIGLLVYGLIEASIEHGLAAAIKAVTNKIRGIDL